MMGPGGGGGPGGMMGSGGGAGAGPGSMMGPGATTGSGPGAGGGSGPGSMMGPSYVSGGPGGMMGPGAGPGSGGPRGGPGTMMGPGTSSAQSAGPTGMTGGGPGAMMGPGSGSAGAMMGPNAGGPPYVAFTAGAPPAAESASKAADGGFVPASPPGGAASHWNARPSPNESEYDRLVREHLEGAHEQRTRMKNNMVNLSSYHESWIGRLHGGAREGASGFANWIRGGLRCTPPSCNACTANRDTEISDPPEMKRGKENEEETINSIPVAARGVPKGPQAGANRPPANGNAAPQAKA